MNYTLLSQKLSLFSSSSNIQSFLGMNDIIGTLSVSHVPCGQMLCLLTLTLVKQAKFALVVDIVMIVSGSIIQF